MGKASTNLIFNFNAMQFNFIINCVANQVGIVFIICSSNFSFENPVFRSVNASVNCLIGCLQRTQNVNKVRIVG